MGYKIEDVGEVWGDEWAGQFRWINDELDGDTFGAIQYSEEAAWADAEQYQRQLQAAIDNANAMNEVRK